jgi:hypothetical protein
MYGALMVTINGMSEGSAASGIAPADLIYGGNLQLLQSLSDNSRNCSSI